MSEVVPETHQEFWRPPALAQNVVSGSSIANALRCCTCQTEFMPGARFCYLCGVSRGSGGSRSRLWTGRLSFLRVLGFQHIKQTLGLPMPSLIGFFAGTSCLAAALLVGKVLTVQTATEFQALQFLRIEWLIGSLAAFVVAILFKCGASQIGKND